MADGRVRCPDSLCVNGRVRTRSNLYGGDDPAGSMCHTCGGRGWVPAGSGGTEELGCIGRAIANLMAVGIIVVITVFVLLSAFAFIRGQLEDDGPPLEALMADLQPGDLQAGTCIADRAAPSIEAVDCAAPHGAEVFHVIDVRNGDDDAWPGSEELLEWARGQCRDWLPDYVGIRYDGQPLAHLPLLPGEQHWAEGARRVACVAFHDAARTDDLVMVGSIRAGG